MYSTFNKKVETAITTLTLQVVGCSTAAPLRFTSRVAVHGFNTVLLTS